MTSSRWWANMRGMMAQAATPPTSTTPARPTRMIQRLTLPLRRHDDGAGAPLDVRLGVALEGRGIAERSGQHGWWHGGRLSVGQAGRVAVAGCVFIDPNSTGVERQLFKVKE